jgi:glycosyltransferase involved in cell wall biosynthesis
MKILHVIPSVAPVRGGASHAVLEMVRAIKDLGVDIEIATTNDNGSDLLNVPLCQRIDYQQVPTLFFPRFSPPIPPIREFAYSTELTTWLWQNISKYDLLHIHAIFSYASTLAMTFARLKKVPYIVLPHGLLCHWSLQQGARKKQLYLDLIERENLNHSRAIQVTAQNEQREVAALGLKAPTFTLPLGLCSLPIAPDARKRLRQRLRVSLDEPVILFMSRLHHKKGLDYLIPALANLKDQPFTFVLAGSGSPEYEAEIRALINTHQLESRTHFAGFIDGEEKNILLQGADLFVLTSHSENFGIAVLEAMSAGLPVIVTPGVGLSSVVHSAQVGYVPNLAIDEITKTIQYCLANPEMTKVMGDRARQFVLETYGWDRIAAQLIEVYTQSLS